MNMNKVEKGDVIALKDGREVRIESTKYDGEELRRFDYIDIKDNSPFRRPGWPSDILRILRKNPNKAVDPKQVRASDNPIIPPTDVRVVAPIPVAAAEGYTNVKDSLRGPEKVEKPIPVTTGVKVGNEAIANKSKPVRTRIKTDAKKD